MSQRQGRLGVTDPGGVNVVVVSRQLGHADPLITLRFYAHLFDRAEHAERATVALEGAIGKAVVSSGVNRSGDGCVAPCGRNLRLQLIRE
jgi:hypothetical protein